METLYRIRCRCRTRTTCQVCQACVEVPSESTRVILADTIDTAAALGQSELRNELTQYANNLACPECGSFSPAHIGRWRMRRHGFLTASVVIALCIVVGVSQLLETDHKTARMIGCTLTLCATLGQIAIALRRPRPNRNSEEVPKTVISPAHLDRRPLPGIKAYHAIAFAATLLAGPVILAPTALPKPPIVSDVVRIGPGEVVVVEFPEELDAVDGFWFAQSPKVSVIEPKSLELPTAQLSAEGMHPNGRDWEPDTNWLANTPTKPIKPTGELRISDTTPLAKTTATVRLEMSVYYYPKTSRSIDQLRRITIWKELRIANRTRRMQDWLSVVPVERLADFFAGLLILSAGMVLYHLAQQYQTLGRPPTIEFDETAAVEDHSSDATSPDESRES